MFFSSLSSGVSSLYSLEPRMMSPGKLIALLCLSEMEMRSHSGYALNVAKLTWLIAVSKQST